MFTTISRLNQSIALLLSYLPLHPTPMSTYSSRAFSLHSLLPLIPQINTPIHSPGAFLTPLPSSDTSPPAKPQGSIMMVTAESEEEVMELLKKDIYTTEGIWDMEKVVIYPVCTYFVCIFCGSVWLRGRRCADMEMWRVVVQDGAVEKGVGSGV